MGTISGTTHIKTIFSFWTGVGKHFIGNALCRSADSFTQLIRVFHSFTLGNFFYKHTEMSNMENEGPKECVLPFVTNDQKTPCADRQEQDRKIQVVL
jgi:hypothetical protein